MVRLQQQNYNNTNSKIQQLGSCAAQRKKQRTVVVAVRGSIHTSWRQVTV